MNDIELAQQSAYGGTFHGWAFRVGCGRYKHGKRWRVVIVNAAGKQRVKSFPTEREAGL